MKIDFMSPKDIGDKQRMHSKSDNIEIMIGNGRDEVINELFETLLFSYQIV